MSLCLSGLTPSHAGGAGGREATPNSGYFFGDARVLAIRRTLPACILQVCRRTMAAKSSWTNKTRAIGAAAKEWGMRLVVTMRSLHLPPLLSFPLSPSLCSVAAKGTKKRDTHRAAFTWAVLHHLPLARDMIVQERLSAFTSLSPPPGFTTPFFAAATDAHRKAKRRALQHRARRPQRAAGPEVDVRVLQAIFFFPHYDSCRHGGCGTYSSLSFLPLCTHAHIHTHTHARLQAFVASRSLLANPSSATAPAQHTQHTRHTRAPTHKATPCSA